MKKILTAVKEYFAASDMLLLLMCTAASVFGIILISSATRSYDTLRYVYVQTLALALGIFIFVIFSIIDIEIITDKWPVLLLFNIVFLGTLLVWGVEGGTGNTSWLRFASIGIQPAEVVKISFTLLFAKHMHQCNERRLNSVFSVGSLVLHFGFIFAFIIFVSDDLGSALVYAVIFVFMMFAGGIKLRWFALGAAVIAAAAPYVWNNFLSDYQKNRILAPYLPSIDPDGLGITWQANQSKIALASGRFSGQGLFNGPQSQSSMLPYKHTDFIFSVAGEELGMIGCIVIILLLAAIIVRCIYVGINSKDYMSMLVCFGFAGMLTFQTFENIGMCIGLTPVIGLTLPFFSYGGSSLVTSFAAMGIVSGIKRRPKPERFS